MDEQSIVNPSTSLRTSQPKGQAGQRPGLSSDDSLRKGLALAEGPGLKPVTARSDAFEAIVFPPNYKKEYKFRGMVKSVSSFNVEGAFDVLPLHENFVTLAKGKVVIVDTNGQRHEFSVGKALLEASGNVVKVFIEF